MSAVHRASACAPLAFAGLAENGDGLASEHRSPAAPTWNVCDGARWSSPMLGERSARLKPPRKRTQLVGPQLASAFQVVLLPVEAESAPPPPSSPSSTCAPGLSLSSGTSTSP